MAKITLNVLLLLLSPLTVICGGPLRSMFLDVTPPMVKNGIDPGKPLFLTPLLESGQIEKARQLSLVGPLKGTNVKSYAGYLTVNKPYNSNLFFWFFPAKVNPTKAPVVMWLQGGPGGSSMFGLFVEHGPFGVNAKAQLVPRNTTWQTNYSMLYVDNPVGTGFSFTENEAGYATDEEDVGNDMYSALVQFFQIYYEYSQLDFYVTGESYAGKYVPAIAYKIHSVQANGSAKSMINLRGIAIGDGLCDPEMMFPAFSGFVYNAGLMDENQSAYAKTQTDQIVEQIQQKQWINAFKTFDNLLNGDLAPYPSFYTNVTGSTDYYNYMRTKSPADFNFFYKFLALPEVRLAIHVGNLTFNAGTEVEKHLLTDVMQSIKPWLAVLMNYYKVMIYNGQLDVIIPVPSTESFLMTVPWQHLDEYKRAERHIWKVHPDDGEVAGYVRRVHDFYQVIVRSAGHILPHDQPEVGHDLINRFISGRPFF
ncbi:probable serine carboxypeptidase CPVL [Lineus longissimus]|uniref:probable serine carboxypeptidase CPVL n=1 Tax=Lineus longissimus TaxID=88925 RepID=UPI002B4D9004